MVAFLVGLGFKHVESPGKVFIWSSLEWFRAYVAFGQWPGSELGFILFSRSVEIRGNTRYILNFSGSTVRFGDVSCLQPCMYSYQSATIAQLQSREAEHVALKCDEFVFVPAHVFSSPLTYHVAVLHPATCLCFGRRGISIRI